MPISFCIVGLFDIFIIFFLNLKKIRNVLFVIGTTLILAGYFVPAVFFAKFSINLCAFAGFLTCIIGSMIGLKGKIALMPIFTSFILSVFYLLVCARDYNYLFYFRPVFLFVLIISLTLFLGGINEKNSFALISYMLCEFLSFLVVGERLSVYPLFSGEIVFCVVLTIAFNMISCFVAKLFRRRQRNEKIV